MTAIAIRPRIDERTVTAGTTPRFALLIVLIVVSSVDLMRTLNSTADQSLAWWGCRLAAGVDPAQKDRTVMLGEVSQADAYHDCMIRYALPPWWQPLGWPVLLAVVALLVFWVLPRWKTRRTVPLAAVDHDGEISWAVAELAATIGLRRFPRVVVDPAAASTGAVVFGRDGRSVLCLHGGLVASRVHDPGRFRAVVLHELAHIDNRDITISYATIALWRAFLFAMVLPSTGMLLVTLPNSLRSPYWSTYAPAATRNLLFVVVLCALVYLARSEVLRTREIYADLSAARWGADPDGWQAPAAPVRGRARRALDRFRDLWRTHPCWEVRRWALADPEILFRVAAMPMFLTGVAAALINNRIWMYAKQYRLAGGWNDQLVALTAASLVAGVAGVALWRAVAHALLTGRPAPSGVRGGAWLGVGMAFGHLLAGQEVISDWLPESPYYLVLVVLAGMAFAWWTSQCAQVWITARHGRPVSRLLLVGLPSAALVMSGWFTWWHGGGALLAAGWPFEPDQIRALLERTVTGPAPGHRNVLTGVAAMIPVVASMTKVPLILVQVAVLWLVPLAAWAARSSSGGVAPSAPGLPPLRLAVLPGVLGGILCWDAVVWTQAYLHPLRPDTEQGWALYQILYTAWLFVALVGPAAPAVLLASALNPRHRLVSTLIAAEVAVLAGFAGMVVLVSTDGCVRPLAVLGSSCGSRLPAAWSTVELLLTPALVIAAVCGGVAAVLVGLLSRVPRPRRGRAAAPAWSAGGTALRRIVVGALVSVAMLVTISEVALRLHERAAPESQAVSRMLPPAPAVAVSAETKRVQIASWERYGGRGLLGRFSTEMDKLIAAMQVSIDTASNGRVDISPARAACVAIGGFGRDAERYFRVPDAEGDESWQRYIALIRQGSRNCVEAVDRDDHTLFYASVDQLEDALRTGIVLIRRLNTLHPGGL
ncbi:heat shock protein HtpX [Micromonospora sp. MW-13]|uniref:M48 family metalloprotease n=1 Tax=Micromonospora sp. MW-13 TaxID=2094022 RepID=UPI000E444E98|nr:M48 family metalloprotease [Micromonospora sp. MW-13]RGC68192.1 heat shock protein HtpX [Micromonospora sp. MW-13]